MDQLPSLRRSDSTSTPPRAVRRPTGASCAGSFGQPGIGHWPAETGIARELGLSCLRHFTQLAGTPIAAEL